MKIVGLRMAVEAMKQENGIPLEIWAKQTARDTVWVWVERPCEGSWLMAYCRNADRIDGQVRILYSMGSTWTKAIRTVIEREWRD